MIINKLVSIIIPAYNAEKYIDKCLQSVLSSTYNNLEIIFVDDKSEDNTLEIARGFQDARLSIIAQENRGGVSQARNIGINKAKGDYIAFVDADDWISSTMIEKLLLPAEKYNSDITICNHFEVYEKDIKQSWDTGGDLIFKNEKIEQYLRMFMFKGKEEYKPYFSIGQPWGTLYKASLIKNNGIFFIEGMQYKEDVIFNLYAALHAKCICRINEPLYYYNKCNANSLTTSGLRKGMLPRIEKDINERFIFYRKYREGDLTFRAGLMQYTCRTFFRNVVSSCVIDADYNTCKKIFQTDEYKKAFRDVDSSYFSSAERAICILIKHNCLPIYYYVMACYVKMLGIRHK